MPLHVVVKLPDGRFAYADYREPVVPAMQRYLKATAIDHTAPRPGDMAAISAWFEANAAQSAACEDFCRMRALTCGHDR